MEKWRSEEYEKVRSIYLLEYKYASLGDYFDTGRMTRKIMDEEVFEIAEQTSVKDMINEATLYHQDKRQGDTLP